MDNNASVSSNSSSSAIGYEDSSIKQGLWETIIIQPVRDFHPVAADQFAAAF